MSTAFLEAVHADPWAESFLDLPALNASASGAIETNVRHVRELARAEPHALRSNSLVVLGPPGAGKTHLFARLRRRLGPKAVFVHVRPLVHTEITPRFVLGEIVKQLGYGTHGVSHLPQVHAMVGSLLAHLDGQEGFFPSTFLAECEAMNDADREARLDAAVEQVLSIWQEVDESYLRRLLQVPFSKTPAMQRSLLAWLSGRDCDVTQLARIGATASLGEDLAVAALRTLSVVAALGAPIVIVFDQLENLVDAESASSRLLAYANLTAELVDSMRGLVLVHMALDTEWSRGIEPALNLSQRSRLLMARETLALPSPKQREELLELWSAQLPDRPAASPWPLTEAQAQRLCRQVGVTPRMLLVEFKRAFRGEAIDEPEGTAADSVAAQSTAAESPPTTSKPQEERLGLASEWEERLTAARTTANEVAEQRSCLDPSRLADGLLACARFLQGASIGSVKGAEAGQLQLNQGGSTSRLAILHHAHYKSLGSALTKLASVSMREPVIVLREQAHDLPPTWKDTLAKKSALLATGRARWIWLEREDAVSLLALDSLLQGARSGDVTDEQGRPLSESSVAEWVSSTLGVAEWRIIREILNPGEVDEESSQKIDSPRAAPTPSGSAAARSATTVSEASRADTTSSERASSDPASSGTALALLRRLRIASLDRVVREVIRSDPHATRASVIAELQQNTDEVRWFGRTILGVRVV
ncbi:MAG TPA: hypothetical protein VFQ61_38790 [Polyangiaceae bacterium]|nr:hypothetical protein [Polyangiaceae bacterium]